MEHYYPQKRHLENKGPPTKKRKAPTVQTFFEQKTDVGVVKHKILQSYLGAWFAMLNQNRWRTQGRFSSRNPDYTRIVYVDGFSGPGFYSNGEGHGSPAVAYELALTHKNLRGDPIIYMIFIEKDPNHCADLFANLTALTKKHKHAINAEKVKFMVINDEFARAMKWILSTGFIFPPYSSEKMFTMYELIVHCENPGYNMFITDRTPLFVFIDPFGYNGAEMPMTLVQSILRRSDKAEILINIMTGFLRRFLNLDNRTRPINLLVGNDEHDSAWKPIALSGENAHERLTKFLQFYQEQISGAISHGEIYPSFFEMRNKGNRLLYSLFHASRHEKGFIRMKGAMRTSSQSDYTFKYSTYRANDPNFQRESVEIESLEQDIIEHFTQDEYKHRIITGREITQFLDNDDNLYQRYRRELKETLIEYAVPKRVRMMGVHSMKFDEMNFKFVNTQKKGQAKRKPNKTVK